MITLIHGPAELLRAEALAEIRAGIAADADLAGLNTAVLEGRQATLDDVLFAISALPFLAERRLVVVERLLARLASGGKGRAKGGESAAEAGGGTSGDGAPQAEAPGDPESTAIAGQAKAWAALLDQVPETTELVLIEEDTVTGGAMLRRLIEMQRAGHARIVICEKPRRGDLQTWIRERAKKIGVQLDAGAVTDLAEYVGDDLRDLVQELIKLRDFTGGTRSVSQADVRRLVPATRAANVFEMVDALAAGHVAQAGRLLHHALEVDGEQPLGLLALFGRRYRQLIQAKALQAEGGSAIEIAGRLSAPDWQVRKLLEQARHQSIASLAWALERILAADEAIKTGKCSDREALDLLLAELSRREA